MPVDLGSDSTSIKVRCPSPLTVGEWTEVVTPKYNTTVRFVVEVPLRRWQRSRRVPGDYFSDLNWLERKLPEWGLLPDGGTIDCEQVSVLIAKSRRFRQTVTRFRGIATVVNEPMLTEALTNGVSSNGRAFGLCFLVIEPQPEYAAPIVRTTNRHVVFV